MMIKEDFKMDAKRRGYYQTFEVAWDAHIESKGKAYSEETLKLLSNVIRCARSSISSIRILTRNFNSARIRGSTLQLSAADAAVLKEGAQFFDENDKD